MIEWTEQLSIGHPVLDAQHQTIISILNRLENSYDNFILNSVLQDLETHAKEHFALEEALIKQTCLMLLTKQQEEHKFFLIKLEELKTHYKDDNRDLFFETTFFLLDWVLEHVMQEDQKIKIFIKSTNENMKEKLLEGKEFLDNMQKLVIKNQLQDKMEGVSFDALRQMCQSIICSNLYIYTLLNDYKSK